MHLIFFGDSVCAGQYVSPFKTWVTRISEKIALLPEGENCIVMNQSVNGNTTRMALERMPFDVQSHGADIILIQFGINDCHFWETDVCLPRVSKAAFEANLQEIIARSRVFGAAKVIINTNHPTNKYIGHLKKNHNDGNLLYNESIRKIARMDGAIELIDIEKKINALLEQGASLADFVLNDGVHLSFKGHDFYFETVYPVIERAFKETVNSKLEER